MILTYKQFVAEIERMATAATHEARVAFALDTLVIMQEIADEESIAEHTDEERELFVALTENLEAEDVDEPLSVLDDLTGMMFEDEDEPREFAEPLVEYLDAAEDWLRYRQSKDPVWITSLAIHNVNAIDYEIDPDETGYSNDDMLAAPEMAAEYERQKSFLM